MHRHRNYSKHNGMAFRKAPHQTGGGIFNSAAPLLNAAGKIVRYLPDALKVAHRGYQFIHGLRSSARTGMQDLKSIRPPGPVANYLTSQNLNQMVSHLNNHSDKFREHYVAPNSRFLQEIQRKTTYMPRARISEYM